MHERSDTPSAAPSEPQPSRTQGSARPESAQRSTQAAEDERAALMAPTPDDSTYYPAARLDVFPRELSRLQPIYPDRAEADGVRGGEVTLLLMIDDNGTVTDAAVAEAKPDGYFEQSALAWALERARFSPAQRNGRNVKCRVLVKVNYSPEARQAEGR